MEALLGRYQDRVLKAVRQKFGNGLREEGESIDIAQTAMAASARDLDQLEAAEDGAPIEWLAGVVENKVYNLARDRGRQKRAAGRSIPFKLDDGGPGAPGCTAGCEAPPGRAAHPAYPSGGSPRP